MRIESFECSDILGVLKTSYPERTIVTHLSAPPSIPISSCLHRDSGTAAQHYPKKKPSAEGIFSGDEYKTDLAEGYRELFHEIELFHLIPMELETTERAAKIGAGSGLKLIDAIHVTSALDVGCPVFVTNDRGIKSANGLTVVQLTDV